MHPLVSIIIPTYNRAVLLSETLESVLGQTYEHWECLVVDDGSTDHTEKVVHSFMERDKRFLFLNRDSSYAKGGNGARNFGLDNSTGDFIQWFDSDDLMFPHFLERKIKLAVQYGSDVVVCKHTSKRTFKKAAHKIAIDSFKSDDFFIAYALGKRPVITNDVMVRKNIIGAIRFDEKLRKAQEFDFFSRLFQQPLSYCFTDEPLFYYREGHVSISNKSNYLAKTNSLIYLSKKMQVDFVHYPAIVERAKRQGRKTYRFLAEQRDLGSILRNYRFFANAHEKSYAIFIFYIVYTVLFQRGFDVIKPKKKP